MSKKKSAVSNGDDAPVETQTLGDYLNSIRSIRSMTLREVEEASGKTVSNAYLSQLEKNKITKPSPNILRSLAEVFVVPYDTLMEKAGYFPAGVTSNDALRSAGDNTRGQAFASANLTKEEEESLLEYLAFLRARKAKKKS